MGTKKIIAETQKRMGTPVFVAGIIVTGVAVIAIAVFIGKSDSGEIDVTAAIQNSNQVNTDARGDASKNVETVPEAFKNMPNGGLVPQDPANAPTPEPEQTPVEDTAASTTPEDATTTSADAAPTDTVDTEAGVPPETQQ